MTFYGTHYHLTELECSPRPIQQPHPPLLIAGAGPRVLSLAAQEADIVGVAFNTAGRMQIEIGSGKAPAKWIACIKEAASDRFSALELNTIVFHVVITDERARGAEELARGWGCTAEELLDTINVLVGSVDEIVEQIQSCRDHFGISYLVAVGPETMDALAPVVGRLAGT